MRIVFTNPRLVEESVSDPDGVDIPIGLRARYDKAVDQDTGEDVTGEYDGEEWFEELLEKEMP